MIAGIALAASVLQLTDQAGRTVKEVYGFLSSVKNAPETVEQTQVRISIDPARTAQRLPLATLLQT